MQLVTTINGYNIVHKDEEGTLYSAKALRGMDDGDLKDALKEGSKSKTAKALEGFCEMHDVAIAAAIAVLRKEWKESQRVATGDTSAPQFVPIEVNAADLNLTFEEEVLLCTVAARNRNMRNPPWIISVGPPSAGKSELMELVKDDSLVYWGGRNTENAILPGTTGDDVHSIMGDADGKCLIYNELAILMGQKEEHVRKFFGVMTDAYGKGRVVISDPARGRVEIPTSFTCFWGTTWRHFKRHLGVINDCGQRFLVLPFRSDRKLIHWEHDGYDAHATRSVAFKSLIARCGDLAAPCAEMERTAAEFSEMAVVLRGLMSTSAAEEVEHCQRLANQLLNLARLRAAIWGRLPCAADVEFFMPLVEHTVMFRQELYELMVVGRAAGDMQKTLWDNATKLGMTEGNEFKPKWIDFITKMCAAIPTESRWPRLES